MELPNGIRVALLATVTLWAASGHADWRKTGMTTGDYRMDAQSDFKALHAKRPNDPPPTTAGKLPGGVKVENGPGNLIFVDMYPGYVAKIQLPNSFKDVVIGNDDVVESCRCGAGMTPCSSKPNRTTPLPMVHPTIPRPLAREAMVA